MFNNTGGVFDVQSGTLEFRGSGTGTSTGATFNVASGATLTLNRMGILTGAYRGTGSGTVAVTVGFG